jgi:hypothetical protein
MTDIVELVTNSLKYYDTNNDKYNKLYSKFKYYMIIKAESDTEHHTFVFYDENRKEILRTRYEIIGTFQTTSNVWVWAWALPSLNKNLTNVSRKILNYGFDILPGENSFLRSELITSRFKIHGKLQLDIHVSIASYISKKNIIYHFSTGDHIGSDIYSINIHPGENELSYYIYLLDEDILNNTLNKVYRDNTSADHMDEE